MTRKTFVRKVGEYQELHRDPHTGIAWVEDGSTGMGHSCHPNIDRTGSVRGMKKLGYWKDDAVCVRSHGYIYNISRFRAADDLDFVAAAECRCAACASCAARREVAA